MTHYLDSNYITVEDNRIKNKEILNEIHKLEKIGIGSKVTGDAGLTGKFILEVVEIDDNKVLWRTFN